MNRGLNRRFDSDSEISEPETASSSSFRTQKVIDILDSIKIQLDDIVIPSGLRSNERKELVLSIESLQRAAKKTKYKVLF